MSQNDRDLPKCRKSGTKEGDGSDLSLSGSQVSLVSRPRSVLGKASFRALSVSAQRVRRPMSAVPTMSCSEVYRDKRRPYSADSQLLLSTCQQKRNKLSACFSLSADSMGLANHDIETDGDLEFSSSTLVSSQLSDQLGEAWMELEMRGLYMGHSGHTLASSSTDNGSDLLCCSDVSEEHAKSEKSLGERIQAMSRVHIHHDIAVCPQSTSAPGKVVESEGGKSEKYANGEDPKKISTKELHLRMVESGLISSMAYSSAYIHRENNVLDRGNSATYEANSQPSSPDTDVSKRHCHQYSTAAHGVRLPTTSSKFWNHDVFQTEDQSNCAIDDITFPKEHDVGSVGGDSTRSLNGLDSQLQAKSSLTSLPVDSRPGNGSQFHWAGDDIGPVRFQQWVTDSSKSNGLASDGDKKSSPFYHGVRLSHSQTDLNTEALVNDCTVEEVLTDSEYSKTSPSVLDLKAARGPSVSPKTSHPSASMHDSHPARGCEKSVKDKTSQDGGRDFLLDGDLTGANTQSGDSNSPSLSKPTTHDKCPSANQNSDALASASTTSVQSVETVMQAEHDVKTPFGSRENFLGRKSSSATRQSFLNDKKVNGLESIKKDQNNYLQPGAKRKTDTKMVASNRRIGRGSSSSSSSLRNLSNAKEEILPGEAQTELMSWMAMCSENFMDKSTNIDVKVSNDEPCISARQNDEDSPYNEIMTILRVLDEKEDDSSLFMELNEKSELKIPEENSAFDMSSRTTDVNQAGTSSEKLDPKLCQPSPLPSTSADDKVVGNSGSGSEPPRKLCTSDIDVSQSSAQGYLRYESIIAEDLLTFLDAVDQNCSSILQPQSPLVSRTPRKPPLVPGNPHNLEELLMMGRSDLAQEIVSLRLSLEDKDATINLLRTALREQKDSQSRQATVHSKELDSRLRQVKSECEAVVKRHQKFIDQLIAEKASLSQKCESMLQEAKECEEKHAKALANLEERHKIEMQRAKDITAATEKLKRERWVENKTQKIKELTVRGLEPELSRLTSQHDQEISALRTLHAQELEQMEVRAARRASQQMEALREHLVQEKEDALTKERDMLRQRMEKQQLLFEEEGAEQRRRLVAEVRREQDRLATLEARLEAQFEERKRALDREGEQERERFRRDYADKINEMHRKQQNEMLQYREALKAEKETWIETYQQQQKQTLIQTSNEIKDQLKRERDREIEIVIERLENEATISREEREKLAENRLNRVREQLTSELRDVESTLNSLKEKHAELRSQLQEKDDKLVSCEALNRSLHTQLVETRKISDQLSAERADLKQIILAELNDEMECLRGQLVEQHTRHQQQLQILSEQAKRERQTHQQELQQLFDRVKLAIAKKEEVVKIAKAKQKAAEEQSSHLQALLNHKRKESFLS